MTTVSAPFLRKGSIFPELPIFFYEGHIPICFFSIAVFICFRYGKKKGSGQAKVTQGSTSKPATCIFSLTSVSCLMAI